MTEHAGSLPGEAEPTEGMVQAAIAWALRMDYDMPDDATRRALARWLADDPRHALAWQRISAMTGELRALPASLARDALRTRDAARGRRRQALKHLGLAGATVAGAWLAGRHAPWQRMIADASTATGGRRTIALADGTVVTLNTDTAIASHLTDRERRLVLLRGEIFVATGADAGAPRHRPFRVHTRDGMLQALGTRFLVRLEERDTRLAVREGAVRLHPGRGPEALASAGEQWLMDKAGSRRSGQPGFEPGGWLDGVIAARGMPLAAFLEELGRYRPGLLAADRSIAATPVTGVFQLQDVERTLAFLARAHGWRLLYRSRYWVTVSPAA